MKYKTANGKRRLAPADRKFQILDAAIKYSIEIGYTKITRNKLAQRIGVASSLIAAYYPKMKDIKAAIMEAAVDRDIIEIIAQGMTIGDPRALKTTDTTRMKVLLYISNIQ